MKKIYVGYNFEIHHMDVKWVEPTFLNERFQSFHQ